MKYMVVLEDGPESVGVYVPDLPGCVAVGETREEALQLIQEAVTLHIESLREHGEPIPTPTSFSEYVEMDA